MILDNFSKAFQALIIFMVDGQWSMDDWPNMLCRLWFLLIFNTPSAPHGMNEHFRFFYFQFDEQKANTIHNNAFSFGSFFVHGLTRL